VTVDLALPAPRKIGHPSVWLGWTACAVSVALLVRNPWCLAALALVAVAVRWHAAHQPPSRATFLLLATLILTTTAVNVIFSRAGETVLLRLPLGWLGGPYTLEAVLFGLSAGIQIATVLLVMMVFGAVLTPADLLRRTPPGLDPVGVASTLALTFAPQAWRSYRELAEARQVRGLAAHGVRETRASVEPLVILSLERAVGQAEALVARGWNAGRLRSHTRLLAVTGWIGLAAGFIMWALRPDRPAAGLALTASATLLISLSLRGLSPRYRPDVWTSTDRLVLVASFGAFALLLTLTARDPQLLSYYPYPHATWPVFPPMPLVVCALLAAPLLWRGDG
jgi:energy-coupling factor transport system permease protein